ncbi:hypothetical protein C804_01476 [Lachnospiraceae bacterium A4]|jgi:hypothetical protein|nr:hypothetical protein C804_01476 [Lachnospiraceae bacterium A4]
MKQLFILLLLLGICFLSSCGNRVQSNFELETINDQSVSNAEKAFLSVLFNEETFVYHSNTQYDSYYSMNGYLKDIPFNDKTMEFSQFAVVDLDGDSMPEIVLAVEEYMGFVILRNTTDGVHGNFIGYRSMLQLKEDGSSYGTASSSEHWIQKKYFVGYTVLDSNKLYVDGASYYIDDLIADKEDADELETAFKNVPEIEWHDYSEESIMQHIKGNTLFFEVSQEKVEHMNGRQEYMDSLQYLIDLTRNYTEGDLEKRNDYAKKYYDSCKDEMNKVYEMCIKKHDSSDLRKMQQVWETGFVNRLSEDLKKYDVCSIEELEDRAIYFTYGDMMLRHTLLLINIYYDCDFYD